MAEKFLIEQAENLLRLPARPETPIVLMYTNDQRHRAEIYTEWCELRQVEEPMPVDVPSLYLDYQGIALCSPGNRRPFRLAEQNLHRRSVGARKGELARACGLNQGDLSILDACAGFGTDGLTLSMLGCPVTLVEREPLIWILLRDFARSFDNADVIFMDCRELLSLDATWDVVYLDPMFPERKKKALPNQGLQHLRYLTQDARADADLAELIQLGLSCANNRVVVKRRLKDPMVEGVNFQIKGKSVRFDIYLKK